MSHYLYGKAPSKKALAIPLDKHFGLPLGRRYAGPLLVATRGLGIAIIDERPIHEAMDKLDNMLGIRINVVNAERKIARTVSNAELFQDRLPAVEVAAEGELLVESTDNKGIVMRHKRTLEKLRVGSPTNQVTPKPD